MVPRRESSGSSEFMAESDFEGTKDMPGKSKEATSPNDHEHKTKMAKPQGKPYTELDKAGRKTQRARPKPV